MCTISLITALILDTPNQRQTEGESLSTVTFNCPSLNEGPISGETGHYQVQLRAGWVGALMHLDAPWHIKCRPSDQLCRGICAVAIDARRPASPMTSSSSLGRSRAESGFLSGLVKRYCQFPNPSAMAIRMEMKLKSKSNRIQHRITAGINGSDDSGDVYKEEWTTSSVHMDSFPVTHLPLSRCVS